MLRSLFMFLAMLSTAAAAEKPDAGDQARLDLAVELIALLDMDQMLGAMQEQMESMIGGQVAQMTSCEAMKPVVQKYAREVSELTASKMSTQTFIPEVAQLYVEVFTQDELQGLIDFYRSPLGEKMLAKMPQVMQGSMAVAERQMSALMPEIAAAAERFGDEVEAARAQCDVDD